MPYIVTTYPEPTMAPGFVGTRTAVATLDEAAAVVVEARNRANERGPGATTSITLNESGDTVGPLPDGTVIEVRRVDWSEIATANGEAMNRRDALAAFNR